MLRTKSLAAAPVAAAAVVVAALLGSGAATPSARADSPNNGLSAYIVATNRGPLPACSADGSNCGPANTVWNYIHVINSNSLQNAGGSRTTVPNAFVISSIDLHVFVNGADYSDATYTPPPNVTPFNAASHRWPATVECSGGPPCTDVQNPAVIPGENIVAFYSGWIHGTSEPNGSYVFTYTIHGTLNGNALDLTASSPKIQMTP